MGALAERVAALADEWDNATKPGIIGWVGNPHADALRALLAAEPDTRANDAIRSALEVCDQVEANPLGWGGDLAVSLARTIRRALLDAPAPAAADGADA